MRHASQKQLVAQAMGYGEVAVARHLAGCERCRQRMNPIETTLRQMAAMPPPEPAARFQPGWEERLARECSRARRRPTPRARGWQAWTVAAACVAALAGALWMTHRDTRPQPVPAGEIAAPAEANAVLQAALAGHLDRVQTLLVELAHAPEAGGSGVVDLAPEQQSARELVAFNRLYQQSSRFQGGNAMGPLLSDLEPILLQIAHSPAQVTASQWRELQTRVEASGILFKVRVADQNLQTDFENGTL